MSRSPTTTNPDWLRNDHAGEILASEFMQPFGMDAFTLASALVVPIATIDAVIEGRRAVDAQLDLRLTRYLGLSEGYFLRLQNSYDLLEAKRALNGALDRIIPRAA